MGCVNIILTPFCPRPSAFRVSTSASAPPPPAPPPPRGSRGGDARPSFPNLPRKRGRGMCGSRKHLPGGGAGTLCDSIPFLHRSGNQIHMPCHAERRFSRGTYKLGLGLGLGPLCIGQDGPSRTPPPAPGYRFTVRCGGDHFEVAIDFLAPRGPPRECFRILFSPHFFADPRLTSDA